MIAAPIADCTAVVFAGGQSRRMGEDKANLVLDAEREETLLQTLIHRLEPLFAEVVVSVDRPRPGLGQRQICDATSGAGPLAGLCAALAATTTPWVFALATDMPFAQAALIVALARRRDGVDAVVPVAGGHAQPLLAFYSRACLTPLQARLDRGGNRGLRPAFAELNVRYVEESELRKSDAELKSFFDLDTPQDFAAARAMQKVQP